MTATEYVSIGLSVISVLIAFGSWFAARASARSARESVGVARESAGVARENLGVARESAGVARESAEAARKSAEMAERLNRETRDTRDVATITACNQRYLDWCSKGVDFDNRDWCYGMWDLHATEFNFFRMGWLPLLMFRFWMNTLGYWYAQPDDDGVWHSHRDYLTTYSGSLTEMYDFFHGIWDIARKNRVDVAARNRKIEDYVEKWVKDKGLPVSGNIEAD